MCNLLTCRWLLALCATVLAAQLAFADADSDTLPDDLAELRDPAFESYASLAGLRDALSNSDASAVTDVALQIAHGETILLRPHKYLPAKKLFDIAASLASDTKNAAALERLDKAAKLYKLDELQTTVSASLKLAKAPRKMGPAVSIDQISPEAVVLYQSFQSQINSAKALGDRAGLDTLIATLPSVTTIPKDQREALVSLAKEAATVLGEGTDTDDAFRKLAAASRSASSNAAQISSLRTQVSVASSRLSALRAQRSVAESQAASLRSRLANPSLNPLQRSPLISQLNSYLSQISSLSSQMSSLQSQINSLNAQISRLLAQR